MIGFMVSKPHVSTKEHGFAVSENGRECSPTVPLGGPRGMIVEDFGGTESSDCECPACGRTFDGLKGMKIHHARFCDEAGDEAITGSIVECDECGRQYSMNPTEAESYDKHFCDNECKGEWQSKNRSGEEHPNWGRVTVQCENCGDDVEKKPSVAELRENHFCDHDCFAEWHSEQMSGEKNPNYDRRSIECTHCGETIQRAEWAISEWNFCDDDCRREHWSERYSGDGNPNWQGGSEHKYGYYWPEQRDKALERDGYECVICGEGRDETGHRPDVHHIVPLSAFNSPRPAHQLGNLITLCKRHHQLAEHGSIEPPMPQSPLTPQLADD